MDEQKKQKNNKIVNIVVNVIVGVILVIALLVTINNISSKQQGYTSLFGTAYMVVQSSSMDPDGDIAKANGVDYKALGQQEGFSKGDMVSVKVLKTDEERRSLNKGDIVSFFIETENDDGERVRIINSHRIIEKAVNEETGEVTYWTRGDNNPESMKEVVSAQESGNGLYYVIGVVKGRASGIGRILNFFNSSTGFLIFIVIPSFLVVIYFAFNLAREILKYKKAGAAEDKAKYEEELIARLRAQGVQIPAELDNTASATSQAAENATPTEDKQ